MDGRMGWVSGGGVGREEERAHAVSTVKPFSQASLTRRRTRADGRPPARLSRRRCDRQDQAAPRVLEFRAPNVAGASGWRGPRASGGTDRRFDRAERSRAPPSSPPSSQALPPRCATSGVGSAPTPRGPHENKTLSIYPIWAASFQTPLAASPARLVSCGRSFIHLHLLYARRGALRPLARLTRTGRGVAPDCTEAVGRWCASPSWIRTGL